MCSETLYICRTLQNKIIIHILLFFYNVNQNESKPVLTEILFTGLCCSSTLKSRAWLSYRCYNLKLKFRNYLDTYKLIYSLARCKHAYVIPNGPLGKLEMTVVVSAITVKDTILWLLLIFCVCGCPSAH